MHAAMAGADAQNTSFGFFHLASKREPSISTERQPISTELQIHLCTGTAS